MKGKPKKFGREKDLTADYASGDFDDDRIESRERFGDKSKHFQRRKTERTALLRAAEGEAAADIESLPVGQVIQVHSLFSEVEADGVVRLCVVRKTLARVSESAVVVGDRVRFRQTGVTDEQGRPEAVVEQVLPRATLLTRADSFKAIEMHPIVANADQMLLVASLAEPWPKWGLIDRMLVAARAGGLRPVVCLNKIDLATGHKDGRREVGFALEALAHYEAIGVATLKTSIVDGTGLEAFRALLANQATVLAGHSGVGKSSLVNAIQPALDLRVGAISNYTGKGRHTTTSARRYPLDFGGYVVDTPGVKMFGLWNLTRDRLEEFFPDIQSDTAPEWRRESYERILESLPG